MRVAREEIFEEDDVKGWCQKSDDHNPLHLDEQAAEDSKFFDGRIVPGMMLLDKVSGLITQWAETKQGTPVISRMTGISFDKPVHLDEPVQILVEEAEKIEDGAHILFFEVTDSPAAEPRVSGSVTVYLLENE